MTLSESYYIPMHKGMVRYLKELGRWTPAAEVRQQYNIDILDDYIEAWNDALLNADTKGIEVNPKNNEWVDLWYSYRDLLPMLFDGKIEESLE